MIKTKINLKKRQFKFIVGGDDDDILKEIKLLVQEIKEQDKKTYDLLLKVVDLELQKNGVTANEN